jgi:hypothetical protein
VQTTLRQNLKSAILKVSSQKGAQIVPMWFDQSEDPQKWIWRIDYEQKGDKKDSKSLVSYLEEAKKASIQREEDKKLEAQGKDKNDKSKADGKA